MFEMKKERNAFTMLELVFVVVILGIVASIGSELIAKVYQGYIVQRAQHRASIKTELVTLQIANRLAAIIPGSAVRRVTLTGATESIQDAMALDPTGKSYTVLQWVGSDIDSFNYQDNTSNKVGWSGFCDVASSTSTSISTPGSDFASVNTIQKNLGRTGDNFSLYFPYDTVGHKASSTGGESITLNPAVSHIYEHYKIAWTSYALVIENGDLYLYYNFDPTIGTNVSGSKSLLMEDITTFKFQGAGGTIRFKICKEEQIASDYNISVCKEKAVF